MIKTVVLSLGLAAAIVVVFVAAGLFLPRLVYAHSPEADSFSGDTSITENQTTTITVTATHDDGDVDDCIELTFAITSISGGSAVIGNDPCVDDDGTGPGTTDTDTADIAFTPDNTCDTFPVPDVYTASFTWSAAHGSDVSDPGDPDATVEITVTCVDDPPTVPTPTPTPTPSPTPTLTPTPSPAVTPAALPPTGGTPAAAGAGFVLWPLLAGLGGFASAAIGLISRMRWRRQR